jgi:hypothetical protein
MGFADNQDEHVAWALQNSSCHGIIWYGHLEIQIGMDQLSWISWRGHLEIRVGMELLSSAFDSE